MAELNAIEVHLYACVYIYIHSHPKRFQSPHHSSINEEMPTYENHHCFELSENMRIGQDQSQQHFDMCLLTLGNGDLPIAELPDNIHISPEYLYKIQDDSSIAIRESLRYFVEKIFPDINANLHAPEQQ